MIQQFGENQTDAFRLHFESSVEFLTFLGIVPA